MQKGARPSLRTGVSLENRPAVALMPWLWRGANLLHLPPDRLAAEVERLAEGLPVEIFRSGAMSLSLDDVEASVAGRPTLYDELAPQLAMMPAPDGVRVEPAQWCELLDARGYLNVSISEGARLFGVSERTFGDLLCAVRAWVEPPGLFASNLVDCLLIQLRRVDARDAAVADAEYLLCGALEDLERYGAADAPRLARSLAWSEARLAAALCVLQALDPSPGIDYAPSAPLVPELEFIASGDAVVCRVAEENLPRVVMMEGAGVSWPGSALGEARNLIERLAMRVRTMRRVGDFFASAQRDYLLRMRDAPTAMRLADVAAGTGLHVSTVSRVLSAHWATCEGLGVFRLSHLAMRALRTRDGAGCLDYAYLERAIRSAASDGLSDRRLAEFLGVPRRTLTYHRLRLGLGRRKINNAKM